MTDSGLTFFSRNKPARYLLPLILIPLVIACIFLQALSFDFCQVDDSIYVTGNAHVTGGISVDNLRWTVTSLHANFYHPLTTISHMLDVELFGLNPSGHHLTNIILHTLNSLLLFLCVMRLTGNYGNSLLISLLFAVHPLHVESVAWISQRKDLLSGFFFFLSLLTYTYYVLSPSLKKYLLVFTLFLFGLLSKPVLVTLPFLFLVLDLLIFRRVTAQTGHEGGQETFLSLFIEKIPFFLTVILFSSLAFTAQKMGGAIGASHSYPVLVRIKNAIVSYALYIKDTIYPDHLAIFYPHPGDSISAVQLISSLLILALITLWVMFHTKNTGTPAAGWFWFTGMLVPVSGLIQVGSHGMADRYTYLSIIGLFLIIPELVSKPVGIQLQGKVKIFLATALVLGLSASAWKQTSLWKSNETLLLHALQVTDNNVLATQGLGTIYLIRGDLSQAEHYFREALDINPEYIQALNGLGTVLFEKGSPAQAILPLKKALSIKSDFPEAHNNLANSLSALKKYTEAIFHYNAALASAPWRGETHLNLGKTYLETRDYNNAVTHLERACEMLTGSVDCRLSLGTAFYQNGFPKRAVNEFNKVLEIDPANKNAHYNLGIAYGDLGENEKAFSEMQKAMGISGK